MSSPNGRQRWPTFAPLLAGIVFTALASIWAPWEVVHPTDAFLRQALGYAPLWSQKYAGVSGAHIDWTALAINFVVIWVICLAAVLMLNMSSHRD